MDLYLGLIVISLKAIKKLLCLPHPIENLLIGNKLSSMSKILLMFLKETKLKAKLKLLKLKITSDS
jgi:hypothetical protein